MEVFYIGNHWVFLLIFRLVTGHELATVDWRDERNNHCATITDDNDGKTTLQFDFRSNFIIFHFPSDQIQVKRIKLDIIS